MVEKKIKLNNANEVVIFVNEFIKGGYDGVNVDFKVDRYIVDAKSVMGVMSCGIDRIATVILHSDDEKLIGCFSKSMELWEV